MVVVISRRVLVLKDVEGIQCFEKEVQIDHDIGNASLSEKNLWTLMLEWGVVDLSVPLLVEGNPLG